MNRIQGIYLKLPVFLLVFLAVSCRTPVQEIPEENTDPVREQFVRANRYMQRRHQDHIAAFVDRLGWDATTTPSGLWIVIEEEGRGARISQGQRVSFTFESRLLDGTPCYSAGENAPKQILVGQGGIESGVEEGLTHLRAGSTATLIIPPHLGHGNFGDRDKIPGNSVLLYHLSVKEVRQGH